MARRFLGTPQTSSQKGKNRHSSPTRRQYPSSSHSLTSPLRQSLPSLPHAHRSCSPTRHPSEMTILVTSGLRNWLTDHSLQGFIQLAEAPPHPNAMEIVSKLNIETLTDSMVRKKLGLNSTSERQFEILPTELLENIPNPRKLSGPGTSPTLSFGTLPSFCWK